MDILNNLYSSRTYKLKEEEGFKEPTTYTTLLSKSIVAKHYYSTDTDFSRTYYGQKVAH